MSVVGKNIPHDSAAGHVSGESIYIDDMPFSRQEVLVDFYWSPVAHGKINSIDISQACLIPGVVGVYTAKDLGGVNKFGPIIKDEPLLAETEVLFIGHPIAVIAAETRDAIAAAKAAIKVEIEPLEPVFTIDEAIASAPNYSMYSNRGLVLQRLGRFAESCQALSKALEQGERSHMAYCNYGNALQQAGRFQDALEAFRSARRLAPDHL
ncbi:MAG TPA: tetratricopeptide repeat protein, partial [Acidobacteriota bacterium]|nr:tetratricopeptide repeat protein [Acidobacteriota bacterium]